MKINLEKNKEYLNNENLKVKIVDQFEDYFFDEDKNIYNKDGECINLIKLINNENVFNLKKMI